MEAAKFDPSFVGQCRGRCGGAVPTWFRAVVSRTWAPARPCSRGRALGAPHAFRVCGRGLFSKVVDPLDVVAGDWRAGDRFGRIDFPASAWGSATTRSAHSSTVA